MACSGVCGLICLLSLPFTRVNYNLYNRLQVQLLHFPLGCQYEMVSWLMQGAYNERKVGHRLDLRWWEAPSPLSKCHWLLHRGAVFKDFCTLKLEPALLPTATYNERSGKGSAACSGILARDTCLSMDIDRCEIKPGTFRLQDSLSTRKAVNKLWEQQQGKKRIARVKVTGKKGDFRSIFWKTCPHDVLEKWFISEMNAINLPIADKAGVFRSTETLQDLINFGFQARLNLESNGAFQRRHALPADQKASAKGLKLPSNAGKCTQTYLNCRRNIFQQ